MPDRDAILIHRGVFKRGGGFAGKGRVMQSWVRPVLTFAAAVAVLAFAKSPAAQASCGDYVTVRGELHHPSDDNRFQQSKPGVLTCHGPHCQRQAPLPVIPTKALSNAPTVDAAYAFERATDLRPSFSGWLFERSPVLAEVHNRPLLRPPCF